MQQKFGSLDIDFQEQDEKSAAGIFRRHARLKVNELTYFFSLPATKLIALI